jgi:hypothetical protein
MPTIPDKYNIAALSLLAAGALFIAIALLVNPGDMTTAALVMAGMVCAMVGIFTWAFSGTAPVDPELVGILPAQGCINFCALTHNLGVEGHAFFLPPQYTGEPRVMQFNPTSTQEGLELLAGKEGTQGSLRETGPAGLVTQPSCDHLIRDLRTRNALVIPENKEELSALLGEAVEDVFKFAQRITVTWEENRILVTFHRYPFMYGCKKIGDEYPACCVISPCPACSLCGALIAEGIGRIVTLDECSVSASGKDVTAVFSIVPLPDDTPGDKDPGAPLPE